jgi:hypothetical protein
MLLFVVSDRFHFETFQAIRKRVPDIEEHVARLGGTEQVAKIVRAHNSLQPAHNELIISLLTDARCRQQ